VARCVIVHFCLILVLSVKQTGVVLLGQVVHFGHQAPWLTLMHALCYLLVGAVRGINSDTKLVMYSGALCSCFAAKHGNHQCIVELLNINSNPSRLVTCWLNPVGATVQPCAVSADLYCESTKCFL